jgi:hypothetical protein
MFIVAYINYISSGLLCGKTIDVNIHVVLHLRAYILKASCNYLAAGNAHLDIIRPGDSTLFPRGLLHFEINLGTENATYLSALNSQNPGTLVHNLPNPAQS